MVHRHGPRGSAVSGGRPDTPERRSRHLRARRPHHVAHPSARSNPHRHVRPRLGAVRGRTDRGNPSRRWFPPGEKHWHGAAATTAMTHIAVTESLNGKNVDWMEKV